MRASALVLRAQVRPAVRDPDTEEKMQDRGVRRRANGWWSAVIAIALCVAAPAPVLAQQAWKPESAVEIVVPSGPGGGTDHTGRVIQKIWQDRQFLEVPASVVNKSGGGGSVALAYLNQYPGNPHYLHVASAVLLTNHIVGRSKLSYTDFTPIALLQSEYVMLAVNSKSPLKNGNDMVARLKQDPATLSFAVGTSLGGANHSAAAALARAAGVDARKLKAVVFKSSSESAVAALGGHVDVIAASASQILPHLRSGAMRAIAVTAPKRLGGELAAVPTLKEFGIDAVVNNFRVMMGPGGLAAAQIAYWDQIMARLAQTDEWKKDLEKNLNENTYMNSRDTRKYLDSENAELKSLMAEMGLAK
jgi:putative tricarboxylic transport membrane protein